MECRRLRGLWPTWCALAMVFLVMAQGLANAQAGRGRANGPAGVAGLPTGNSVIPDVSPDALQSQIAAAQGRAPINANPALPVRGQDQTWEEFVRTHPDLMRFIHTQSLGYPVRGGIMIPGYGVVNGAMFGGPNTFGDQTRRGVNLPGFGVVNGEGIGGVNDAGDKVAGGTNLPGFGVVGGSVNGYAGGAFGPLPSGPAVTPFTAGNVNGFNAGVPQFNTAGVPQFNAAGIPTFNAGLPAFNMGGAVNGFNTAGGFNNFNAALDGFNAGGAINGFNAAGGVNTFNAAMTPKGFSGPGMAPTFSTVGVPTNSSPVLNPSLLPANPNR